MRRDVVKGAGRADEQRARLCAKRTTARVALAPVTKWQGVLWVWVTGRPALPKVHCATGRNKIK